MKMDSLEYRLEGIIAKNFLVIQEEQPGLDLLLGEVTR